MGFVDNLKGMFLSVDDEYDDMVDYSPQETVQTAQQPAAPKPTNNQYFEEEMIASMTAPPIQQHRTPSNKVMTMPTAAGRSQATQMVLKKPTKFEEAFEIGAEIKARRTVFLNLEATSSDVSKRLFDFLSGVTFAMDGKVQKLAHMTYLLAPHDAHLLGEDFESSRVDELETPTIYYNN